MGRPQGTLGTLGPSSGLFPWHVLLGAYQCELARAASFRQKARHGRLIFNTFGLCLFLLACGAQGCMVLSAGLLGGSQLGDGGAPPRVPLDYRGAAPGAPKDDGGRHLGSAPGNLGNRRKARKCDRGRF